MVEKIISTEYSNSVTNALLNLKSIPINEIMILFEN